MKTASFLKMVAVSLKFSPPREHLRRGSDRMPKSSRLGNYAASTGSSNLAAISAWSSAIMNSPGAKV